MTPFRFSAGKMSWAHVPFRAAVYRITCVPTGEFYIGGTVCLRERAAAHKTGMVTARHPVGRINELVREYGVGAFEMDILELGPDRIVYDGVIQKRELEWIKRLGPTLNRWREREGGRMGIPADAERERMRKVKSGQKAWHERKAREAAFST